MANIDFPSSPLNGNTYTFGSVTYTYVVSGASGYWAVLTGGTTGQATGAEVNTGTDNIKYMTPLSIENSEYVKEADAKAYADSLLPSHIGQIIQTFSTSTPNALGYLGTWVALDSGLSIQTGTPNSTPSGSNNPAVPLLQHSHASTASFVGTAMPGHLHGRTNDSFGVGYGAGAGISSTNTQGSKNSVNTDSTSAGTPAGTITMSNPSTGTVSPTIDVRGAHVVAKTWYRTA